MLVEQELEVQRWYVPGEFNPGSSDQLRDYMEWAGHSSKPNKQARTSRPSTNEQTLERLARKDAFYGKVLEWRKLSKMSSTYVGGLLGLLDANDRVHPKFLHNPSTWRLSCVEPNWQNVPDAEAPDAMEKKFRIAVAAASGHSLVEADFSAIEAVQTGWYCSDQSYVRLARLGIHSFLVSHRVAEPADLSWDDEKLGAHLAYIKKKYKDSPIYAAFKRTVHLTNYGGTPYMMVKVDNKLFPTVKAADEFQKFYLALLPKLAEWQKHIRLLAAKQNYLGGHDHPYRFKHWFWDVMKPNGSEWMPGSDWNRVVAFYPQSTAAGNLYDTMLDLMNPESPNYVGDMYRGRTPLRAFIHDSILAEVPNNLLDEYLIRLRRSMTRPILCQPLPWDQTKFLTIDADVKVGANWGAMETVR